MASLWPAPMLLALPWLNPFAPNPSPAVVPWLVTLASIGLALLAFPWRRLISAEALTSAWLIAALCSAAIGLCQYYGVERWFYPWMNLSDGQAYGNLRQRNQFASLLSIAFLALLWRAGQSQASARTFMTLAGAAVLLVTGLSASASRTGLIELGLLLALGWAWWRRPLQRQVMLIAALAYGAAVGLLPWLAGRDPMRNGILARFDEVDCGSRLVLWRNVLELVAERPWTGWGWGELDYAHFMHLYDGPRFCEILGNAHNLPLHLAVELGVPVAALLAVGMLWWIGGARPWREREATHQLAWGVLALLGVHSLLEYPLWYGPFALAAVLALGLLLRRDDAPGQLRVSRAQRLLAALLLAAVAYAAWDYWRVRQLYLPVDERAVAYRDDTLNKVRGSWLYGDQVRFAELNVTPLTRENAAYIHDLALATLHYSPEARVAEKLIESAVMLGRDDEALVFLARMRAAYPAEYKRWRSRLNAGAGTDDAGKH